MKYYIIIITIFVLSCKTQFNKAVYYQSFDISIKLNDRQTLKDSLSYLYSRQQKIIIKNDSILTFSKRYYGLGSLTDIKYKKINNIIKLDSIDIFGKSIKPLNIGNLKCDMDTLIDLSNGIKYYKKE